MTSDQYKQMDKPMHEHAKTNAKIFRVAYNWSIGEVK
jgi:hypothetical protein